MYFSHPLTPLFFETEFLPEPEAHWLVAWLVGELQRALRLGLKRRVFHLFVSGFAFNVGT